MRQRKSSRPVIGSTVSLLSLYYQDMQHDRYGLELTTDSADAAAAYGEGADRMLASRPGGVALMEEALAIDPGFALPHVALSRSYQMAGQRDEAIASADRATALASSATEREQSYVALQHRLLSGPADEALGSIKSHIAHYPLDAMALAPASSVFGLIGFSGRIGRESEQLALLAPLAEQYGDDWWFKGVHAFALVETGRWVEGRELVERSLELNPLSAHAAHIQAHALYEAGEDIAAIDFLGAWLPDYDRSGSLHCHLWWHYCLLLVAEGEAEKAWAAFDANVAPDVSTSPPLNILSDGASLHWRAKLAGHEVGEKRWNDLHHYYQERWPAPATFADAHASLPMVALGHFDELDAHIAEVERLQADGKLAAGTMAVTMAKAFRAYAEERWSDVISTLQPHLHEVVCIGGSRAQRDLALNTVLAAYERDGRWDEAEALLGTVTDRRPNHPVGQTN